jgi:hypothetical protein
MKRLWLVLLSLGLVLAFSASAMAVDVKFSGDFTIGGMYLDKTKLVKDTSGDGPSTAFYYQRLRLKADFVVSPGLSFITRADVLSRIWGGERSDVVGQDSQNIGTRAEEQNIAFNQAYISYASPIGIFNIGYIHDNVWGTAFGDSDVNGPAAGGIEYILPIGNFVIGGELYKESDNSKSAVYSTHVTDNDTDKFCLWGMYHTQDISFGLLYAYLRGASSRPGPSTVPYGLGTIGVPAGSLVEGHIFEPFVRAKIGPVKIEAEVDYAFGHMNFEDGLLGMDTKIENLAAYLNVVADFGMVYVGGTAAYVSGNDPGIGDRSTGGFLTGGADFIPCLILFSQDLSYWAGAPTGYDQSSTGGQLTNVWFFQGKGGVRPVAPLDLNVSVSYANADKKPTSTWLYNSYGWEVDLTGTYKITNNLSYMLGFGYLFTGDYFKGQVETNQLTNDYIVLNKLTLTF